MGPEDRDVGALVIDMVSEAFQRSRSEPIEGLDARGAFPGSLLKGLFRARGVPRRCTG